MIQIAQFTKKFFTELVKLLYNYGVLYVTEDGNIYRQEKQAINRCMTKEKLAHLNGEVVSELRWAKVTKNNPPADKEEFEEMLEDQYKERRASARATATASDPSIAPTMSDKEAEEILNSKKASEGITTSEKTITVNEVEYSFDLIRDAIRAEVDPKLKGNTGFDKVKAAYEALSEEDKAKVAAFLVK